VFVLIPTQAEQKHLRLHLAEPQLEMQFPFSVHKAAEHLPKNVVVSFTFCLLLFNTLDERRPAMTNPTKTALNENESVKKC